MLRADHNWAFEFVRARHELGAADSVQAAAACMNRLRAIKKEFETAAMHVAECVVRELYLDNTYQSIPRSVESVLPAHVLGGLVVLVANDSLACLGGDEAAAKMEVHRLYAWCLQLARSLTHNIFGVPCARNTSSRPSQALPQLTLVAPLTSPCL